MIKTVLFIDILRLFLSFLSLIFYVLWFIIINLILQGLIL